MPFGLVCAVATYIHLMRIGLRDLANVVFYFDNIWVFSPTWETHLQDVQSVLQRLEVHGQTARPSKCSFGVTELNYLGYRLSTQFLSIPAERVSVILSLEPPISKKGLRSVLGLLSFYRKFISNFSNVTASLSDMLRKDVKEPLIWSNDALSSFRDIKDLLSSSPVLRLPDISKPFVLRTDASATALGAILLQYHDDLAHPVAYASRKLLEREINYSTIERECLAIIHGVSKFSHYLIGKEFLLEVDHKPLVYLNKSQNSNSRLMRWSLSLQPYRFRIVHIPGTEKLGGRPIK